MGRGGCSNTCKRSQRKDYATSVQKLSYQSALRNARQDSARIAGHGVWGASRSSALRGLSLGHRGAHGGIGDARLAPVNGRLDEVQVDAVLVLHREKRQWGAVGAQGYAALRDRRCGAYPGREAAQVETETAPRLLACGCLSGRQQIRLLTSTANASSESTRPSDRK